MVDQYGQILEPLPQRRYLHRKHVQPIEQILPEAPREDGGIEIPMGRCDDAHIAEERAIAADPLEGPLLQHPQELDLHLQRHIADLVQKKSPALGELETAEPRRQGARERALFMSEQLALEQVRGNGAAVDRHERMSGAA